MKTVGFQSDLPNLRVVTHRRLLAEPCLWRGRSALEFTFRPGHDAAR
jgi:hypothetical protein